MKLILFFFILSLNISFGAVSKTDIKKIFSRLTKLYKDDFDKRNLKLVFKIKNDERINAEATSGTLNSNKRLIYLYKGYLNHSCQTQDSLVAVLCHEIGHHIASENKNTTAGLRRYVVEGEADYFAAKECLPRYYRKYLKQEVASQGEGQSEIAEYCASSDDYNTCLKTLTASYNKIFCSYKLDRRFKLKSAPSFKTPATNKALWTSKYHPSPQCRLDTYLKGYFQEARPRCWHKNKAR